MSNPSAGWFPDPEDGNRQRYWDGSEWTEHYAPTGPPLSTAAHGGPPPNAGGATAALVLGIVSLLGCGLLTGIPAMIFGRRASREIDSSHGALGGRGLATAGFVTGLIGTILMTIPLLIVVVVFAFGSSMENTFEGTCTSVTAEQSDADDC